MRYLVFNFIYVSLVASVFTSSGIALAATVKQKVILSYFEGFAGSDSNQSQVIAALVKANFAADPSIEIVLCQGNDEEGLKVAFSSARNDLMLGNKQKGPLEGSETAFQQLSHCYELNSDAREIISLAQGNCELNVAGVAYNAMETGKKKQLADNNGNLIPIVQKIDPSGPDYLFTDDLNILSTCFLPDSKILKFSNDIGDYVCNNLLYDFQAKIKLEHLPVNYSMVHVPLDFESFKKKCDKKIYKETVQSQDEKLTNESMNTVVSNEVTAFIKAKHQLVLNFTDLVGAPSQKIKMPEFQSCSYQLKAMRANAQDIYQSHYREKN